MSKKLLFGTLAIAIVAIVFIPALMDSWNGCTITMHATSGEQDGINCFEDCLASMVISARNWGWLAQNQQYEIPLYVCNLGNKAVMLYYYVYPTSSNAWIPTIPNSVYPGNYTIFFENRQVQFDVVAQVIQGPGLRCQLPDVDYQNPVFLPCKFVGDDLHVNQTPSPVVLLPGQVIKLDVQLFTHSLVNSATYDWTFVIDGLTSVAINNHVGT
jgi:hypothetical protein